MWTPMLLLLSCSVLVNSVEQRQDPSGVDSGDATQVKRKYGIDVAELLKSPHQKIQTLRELERNKNVSINLGKPLNIRKFMSGSTTARSKTLSESGDNVLSESHCGKATSRTSSRIVGGETADFGEWPWQAMILRDYGYNQYFVCGGSLIDNQWVVSAAHCFDTREPSETVVALGAHFQDLSGSNTQILTVSAIICHEEYDSYTLENDICLVKLASVVEYTDYISPICLPSSEDNAVSGETCAITGWGQTQGTGNDSVLQEAYVEVFPRENCTEWYLYETEIPEGHLCAGTTDASKGACYGDSGGPLACERSDGDDFFFTLFGITSFGSPGCLTPERPSVFTSVAYYLDWIEDSKTRGVDICYDPSTIHSCKSVITENNTLIRSPVADNSTWYYPSDSNCSWLVRAPTGYVVKIEFLCFLQLYDHEDCLTIKPQGQRVFRYCGLYHNGALEPLTTRSDTVNISFHSQHHDWYGTAKGFVLRVSFVESDIYDGDCGIGSGNAAMEDPLIAGGSDAPLGEWPWQAMVYFYEDFDTYYYYHSEYYLRCGGTLINDQWILSSASCFKENSPGLYFVVLGADRQFWYWDWYWNSWYWNPSIRILAVGAILCHDGYDERTAENNICLVKLSTSITFSTNIRPACIPGNNDQVRNGESCTVTGFGVIDYYHNPYHIQAAEVDIYPRTDCVNWYKKDDIYIAEENFCAGRNGSYYLAGPCHGDYGGPLVCQTEESPSFKVMGIANFGPQICGQLDKPVVFTKVARYSDWIDKTMSNAADISMCFDIETVRSCGSTISANNTIIRSPILDEETWQYPNDIDCEWDIQAPTGKKIKIEFLCFFNLEYALPFSYCTNDYLSITEASKSSRYCGSHNVQDLEPYTTEGNEVKLRFHSNEYFVTQGFILRISEYDESGAESDENVTDKAPATTTPMQENDDAGSESGGNVTASIEVTETTESCKCGSKAQCASVTAVLVAYFLAKTLAE